MPGFRPAHDRPCVDEWLGEGLLLQSRQPTGMQLQVQMAPGGIGLPQAPLPLPPPLLPPPVPPPLEGARVAGDVAGVVRGTVGGEVAGGDVVGGDVGGGCVVGGGGAVVVLVDVVVDDEDVVEDVFAFGWLEALRPQAASAVNAAPSLIAPPMAPRRLSRVPMPTSDRYMISTVPVQSGSWSRLRWNSGRSDMVLLDAVGATVPDQTS